MSIPFALLFVHFVLIVLPSVCLHKSFISNVCLLFILLQLVREADWAGCVLTDAQLQGCVPPPSFGTANLRRAKLSGLDLSATDLARAALSAPPAQGNAEARGGGGGGADLSGCLVAEALLPVDLRGVRLCGVELARWRRLEAKQLAGADLAGCALGEARLPLDLQACGLAGLDLAHRDLAQAQLAGADLTGAKLAGVNLSGANLAGRYVQQRLRYDFALID